MLRLWLYLRSVWLLCRVGLWRDLPSVVWQGQFIYDPRNVREAALAAQWRQKRGLV